MEQKAEINAMKPHQYEDIYKSDDVPFYDLSKGTVRRLVRFGIALFLVLLILSFIVKIPREVHIPFELKGGLSERIYQYPEQIYIQQFFVQPNDSVFTSDSLVKITSQKIVKYLEEYELWQSKLLLFNSSKQEANKQSIALLQAKLKGYSDEIHKVENEKRLAISAGNNEKMNLQQQVNNEQKQHDRNIRLHAEGVISDLDLESSLNRLQEAEQELISIKEKYALQVAQIESKLQLLRNNKDQAELEVSKKQADIAYELDDILKNLDLARKKIELNYGSFVISGSSIILLNEQAGRVTLRSENEYKVLEDEIILRILTDSLGYFAFADAEPKDIGLVKSGIKAVLKFRSFPHYYYGTMEAKVVAVSPSPGDNGNFPVKLQITNPGKLDSKVTKGMTGTASFVVEEKSVFDFIMRAFLKVTTIE